MSKLFFAYQRSLVEKMTWYLERIVNTELSRNQKASGRAQQAEREHQTAFRDLRAVQQKISELNDRISEGSTRLKEIESQQQANDELRVIHQERNRVEGTIGIYENQLKKETEKRILHAKRA